MRKPIITICASAAHYKQAVEAEQWLKDQGLTVLVPTTAKKMQASGDYDVSHYKTWYDNKADYHLKTERMRGHFEAVAKADAILVVNYEKHGITNYIGGNVLMEMALAFYLKKPIYILNGLPAESAFEEEIVGMFPILLNGNLKPLAKAFQTA